METAIQWGQGRLDHQETGIRFPVGVQTRLNTGFEACSEGL